MGSTSLSGSIILLVVGAAIGFVPTFLNERAKRRHALETRWDEPLFELSKAFVSSARQLQHLSRRLGRALNKEAQLTRIDQEHLTLRSLAQQIRLIGNKDVQEAALKVQYEAYAVRAVGEGKEDKRRGPNDPPANDRLIQALNQFYIAVRRQLNVHQPDEMSDPNPWSDNPWRPNSDDP